MNPNFAMTVLANMFPGMLFSGMFDKGVGAVTSDKGWKTQRVLTMRAFFHREIDLILHEAKNIIVEKRLAAV